LLLGVVLAAVAASAEKTNYTGYSVLRSIMPLDAYRALEDLGFEVWNAQFVKAETDNMVQVDVFVSPEQRRVVSGGVEVVIEDMQALIDEEAQRISQAVPFDLNAADDTFFLDFRNFADQTLYFNDLVRRFPAITRTFNLGLTVEGRPIPAVSVTASANPRVAIYIQACVHAREWLAPPATLWALKSLLEGYGNDAQITNLLNNAVVHVVPTVNIDGYIFTWTNTRLWRKNRRNNGGSFGVDINRNWGPDNTWCTSGSSRVPTSDTFCGTGPFSEPETAASGAFIDRNPNIRAAVDMHTYGPLLLWPWQYTFDRIPANDYNMFSQLGGRMATAINAVAGQRYVSQQGSALYPHSGGLVDYCWVRNRIKSFTFEGRGTNFVVPPSNIIPAGQEQFQGLLVMAIDALTEAQAETTPSA